ncbi:MAG: LacI family DNA-binding transcriptional regulator [Phototrophicaceae bacterium]
MTNKPEKKRNMTMTDIARLAGVSQSTVSRVLNGSAGVAPDKQSAVMEVIERLNYRPNVIAQGLAMGQTLSIGVLSRYVGSPFFSNVLRGIEAGIKEKGYYPIIVIGGVLAKDDEDGIEVLLSRRVDGLILHTYSGLAEDYLHDVAAHTPTVIIGQSVKGLENQCITIKDYDASYQATSYLIQKGHKMIAHAAGPATSNDAQLRRDGYLKAMADAGLQVYPELIIDADYSEVGGAYVVDQLLRLREQLPFTAIFAANDQTAVGVRLALYRRGIAVPDDISLMGFDDIPEVQYMIPPLTTMRQPMYQIGYTATQSLFALMNEQQIQGLTFPVELIERETVRPLG